MTRNQKTCMSNNVEIGRVGTSGLSNLLIIGYKSRALYGIKALCLLSCLISEFAPGHDLRSLVRGQYSQCIMCAPRRAVSRDAEFYNYTRIYINIIIIIIIAHFQKKIII